MSSNPRNAPRLRPVQRIELSEANITLRVILLAALLLAAAAAFIFGFSKLLSTEEGWKEVKATSDRPNLSEEFRLQYYFSDSKSSTADNRQITALFTEAMEKAYVIFSKDVQDDQVNNLCYLNAHPNEDVTVDAALFRALSKIAQHGSRYICLAPVYTEYDRIFTSESPAQAAQYDPAQNGELVEYIAQAAGFASDPNHINIEILGENRVRLNVSGEYLAFAQEYELESLLDFSWTRNAFVADYLAELMLEKGYNGGVISSYDGFTRNLDGANAYSLNIFDRAGNEIFIPARMDYTGPMSVVFLRNYPLSNEDRWHYYTFADSIATVFIDPADGMSRSSVSNLVSYSKNAGCADILLQTAPLFISETLDTGSLSRLTEAGIFSVWGDGSQTVCFNDPDIALVSSADAGIEYTRRYVME